MMEERDRSDVPPLQNLGIRRPRIYGLILPVRRASIQPLLRAVGSLSIVKLTGGIIDRQEALLKVDLEVVDATVR